MFEQVKQEIDDKIKTNGNNEITANRLNGVLQDMMDASAEVIEEVQQSIGDQVEANPTGVATDSLEKIKIGETIYEIPETDTSNLATKQELQQGLATKQDVINDLQTIRSGANAGATAIQGVKVNDVELTPDANKKVNIRFQDIVGGLAYGGIVAASASLTPDTSCYYITNGSGTYTAFGGVQVPSNDHVQILTYDGTQWQVTDLPWYTYAYAHGKFDLLNDFGGATDSTNGITGLVPAPQAGDEDKILGGNGEWVTKPSDGADGADGKSAYQIWLDEGNIGSEQDFLNSLKAQIGAFLYADFDATAYGQISAIGDAVSSIDGKTPDSTTVDKIVLMPNAANGATATMMFSTNEVSSNTYQFVYIGDVSIDASTFVLKSDIVNNLTTGGASKVLSAEQGKVVNAKIETPTTIDGTTLAPLEDYAIGADHNYGTNNAYKHREIPNNGYLHVSGIASSYSGLCIVGFYSGTPSSETFISGVTAVSNYVDQSYDVDVPEGTAYIVVVNYASSTGATINLTKVINRFDTLENEISSLEDNIDDIEQGIEDINTDLDALNNFIIDVDGTTLAPLEDYAIGADHNYGTNNAYKHREIPNNGYLHVSGIASSYSGLCIVGFYSGTPSSETFISGVTAVSNYVDQSYDVDVPEGTAYIVVVNYASSTGATINLSQKVSMSEAFSDISQRVDALESAISGLEGGNPDTFDAKVIMDSDQKILGLGASFMEGNATGTGTANVWLHLLGQKLGLSVVNAAVGGTNIMDVANKLKAGTLLGNSGTAQISDIGSVLIMHSHDKDVFTLPEPFNSYTVAEYEANVVPFASTTGTTESSVEYAKAFDYVIKKIQALYYAYKGSTEYASGVQSYVGQYYFKPAQIILCTHWHDQRSVYNNSVRKLCEKWGIPLVQFDKKIGFTKDKVNTAFGYQPSLEFVGNVGGRQPVETVNGVAYGWHPMSGNDEVYIQRKMASIVKDNFDVF